MRISSSFWRRCAAVFMAIMLLLPSALAQTTYLTCAIVATDDLALRPLELNQRDPVSVLDLVYEGLFSMDDNYMPQPELAYSYDFANNGQQLLACTQGYTQKSSCKNGIQSVIANAHAKIVLPRTEDDE